MDTAPAEYDPQLDRSFRGHKGPIHALDFNVNMKQLAGASLDHCVYVWNFRQQLRAFRFTGHTVSLPVCLHVSGVLRHHDLPVLLSICLPGIELCMLFDFCCVLTALRIQCQEISALI